MLREERYPREVRIILNPDGSVANAFIEEQYRAVDDESGEVAYERPGEHRQITAAEAKRYLGAKAGALVVQLKDAHETIGRLTFEKSLPPATT